MFPVIKPPSLVNQPNTQCCTIQKKIWGTSLAQVADVAVHPGCQTAPGAPAAAGAASVAPLGAVELL